MTLYCAYDYLLNVSNMKYSGILQEMITFAIAFIHHNIGAMLNITSQSGASKSFKTAEKRLKAASEKKNCYYKTYIKKYPIEYETMTGNVQNKIKLRQCYTILGMDHLVRLTTKRDPLPEEGRTNQVCTLPLKINVIWILKTVFVKVTPFLLRMVQREAYYLSHLLYCADIHPRLLGVMMTFINLKRYLMMFW